MAPPGDFRLYRIQVGKDGGVEPPIERGQGHLSLDTLGIPPLVQPAHDFYNFVLEPMNFLAPVRFGRGIGSMRDTPTLIDMPKPWANFYPVPAPRRVTQ